MSDLTLQTFFLHKIKFDYGLNKMWVTEQIGNKANSKWADYCLSHILFVLHPKVMLFCSWPFLLSVSIDSVTGVPKFKDLVSVHYDPLLGHFCHERNRQTNKVAIKNLPVSAFPTWEALIFRWLSFCFCILETKHQVYKNKMWSISWKQADQWWFYHTWKYSMTHNWTNALLLF